MTTRDLDQAPVIDQDVRLDNGHRAVWAVTPDGGTCAWLLAPTCSCGYCDEPTVGCADAEAAPHEQLGPLPGWVLARIANVVQRCSRPRKDGRPCRTRVGLPGDACWQHRTPDRRVP